MGVVEDAVAERVKGGRPGWFRAVLAAVVVGAAAGVLAYRLLRSGSDSNEDSDSDSDG